MRPAPGQDRISVPVKIGNPIGSDSPAYLALTAAEAVFTPKAADVYGLAAYLLAVVGIADRAGALDNRAEPL